MAITPLDWAQFAAHIATTIGVAGVAVAYVQFRAGAKAQRVTTAIVAWNEYLRLALAHPNHARPAEWVAGQGKPDPNFGEYRWFVAAMLFACEQVLEAHPGDPAWEAIVKAQLRNHRGFLALPEFDQRIYSGALTRLASAVRSEVDVVPPQLPQM